MWLVIIGSVMSLASTIGMLALVLSVLKRIAQLEDRVDSATFVPPCAHEWRKVAETVVPSVTSGGFQSSGFSAWEITNIQRERLEAAQGSTVLVLACDKCGERVTETVKGAPRQ